MKNKIDCFKCGGNGNIPAFGHIAGGRCFQCGGSGDLGKVKVAAKRETNEAKELRIARQEIAFQETILKALIAEDAKREYNSEEEAFGPARAILNQEAYVDILKNEIEEGFLHASINGHGTEYLTAYVNA